MQALIDGDLVCYRCAASADGEELDIALLRTDKLMRQLITETNAETYRVFLSGTTNFRKEIDPEYKANRKDLVPPRWLQDCRAFLVREWNAEVQDHIEADDALGIHNTDNCIIVSLDKDLLQIPGKHYQWGISGPTWTKEAKFIDVSDITGLRTFYASSLIGDKSDNILGVDGIGKVKAAKLLENCDTEQEMFDVCRERYNDDVRFIKNLQLLYILRHEQDEFNAEKRGLLNGLDTSTD